MKYRKPVWNSVLFTSPWIAAALFVFCYYPMTSVFHQPTGQRVVLASAFLCCVLANIYLAWVDLEGRFTSRVVDRGLGWIPVILLLWYS